MLNVGRLLMLNDHPDPAQCLQSASIGQRAVRVLQVVLGCERDCNFLVWSQQKA